MNESRCKEKDPRLVSFASVSLNWVRRCEKIGVFETKIVTFVHLIKTFIKCRLKQRNNIYDFTINTDSCMLLSNTQSF